MNDAKDVVAGVLSAVLVIVAVGSLDGDMPVENAAMATLAFAGLVALLVGVDVSKAYHDLTGRSKSADKEEEPD